MKEMNEPPTINTKTGIPLAAKQRKFVLKSVLAERANRVLSGSIPPKMRMLNEATLQAKLKGKVNKIKQEKRVVQKSTVGKVQASGEGPVLKKSVSGKSPALSAAVSMRSSAKLNVSAKSPSPKEVGLANKEKLNKVVIQTSSSIANKSIIDTTNLRNVRGDVKVLTVEQINRDSNAQRQAVGKDKKTEQPQEKDKPTEGYFELNKLMTNVLNEEIEDITLTVLGELSEEKTTTSSRIFVVDKLRTEVVPQIQTTLGLNATKRLLNVYNPLFVKIQFSWRPESGTLVPFLNKYNIKNFKRIESGENTFVAEMVDIADFDVLCTAKNLTCGSAKIKITPCYKFTQCPPKLKTQYRVQVKDNHLSKNLMLEELNKESQSDLSELNAEVENKPAIKSNIAKVEKPLKLNIEANKNIDVMVSKNVELKRKVEETKGSNSQLAEAEIKIDKDTNIKKKAIMSKRKKKENSNSFEIIDERVTDGFSDEEMNDEDILALLSGKGVVLK